MPLRRTGSLQHRPHDPMSEPNDTPQKQGRRRRRRGGRNRNNSKSNSNNQSNHSTGTNGSNSSKGQQGKSNKSGGNSRGRRRPRNRGPRKPIKLSWWEKLLVVVGLKEDPNKRTGKPGTKKAPKQAPKSNTRNARSKNDGNRSKADSGRKRGGRNTRRRGGDTSTVESGRVYVGNLSYDVTEEDLKELFKGIGTVRRVEIVYNRNTHRSKGYGFVEMMNKDDAIRSVEVLDDQPFMGRNMNVSGAKNKSESNDPDELEPEMQVHASEIELAPLPRKTEEDILAEATTEEPVTVAPKEVSAESETAALPEEQTEVTAVSDSDVPVTDAIELIAEFPTPIQPATTEVSSNEIPDAPEEATPKTCENLQEEEHKQT